MTKFGKLSINTDCEIANNFSTGIGGIAKYHIIVDSTDTLVEAVKFAQDNHLSILILGGGSNMIMCENYFDGVVLEIRLSGIHLKRIDDNSTLVNVMAGEKWHDFVEYSLNHKLWGAENLVLIPGTVGASPVQNIGAFGQEVKNIIHSVQCFDTLTNEIVEINNKDCEFSFRKSIFNSNQKNRYVIISVTFCLSNKPNPILSRNELKHLRNFSGSYIELHREIARTITSYRSNGRNLPNSQKLGSAGTFFKTTIVSDFSSFVMMVLTTLKNLGIKPAIIMLLFAIKYSSKGGIRVPSKMLIQFCGLSNLKKGSVYLLPTNPAVVVTELENDPKFCDLLDLIEVVTQTVFSKTGVTVSIEPELIGFTDLELSHE